MPDFGSIALQPQVLVVAIGLILLLVGGRFYRFAIVAPGFVAGVFTARNIPDGISDLLHFQGKDWILALGLGITCALILNKLEKWAVRTTGAVLAGGLAHILLPHPLWVPLASALTGAIFFPPLYKKLLPITTSLLGAVCITWSFESLEGPPQTLYMAGALSVVGIIAQTRFFKPRKEEPEEEPSA